MTLSQAARTAAVATLATAGLFWMGSLSPLQLPSVLAYSGIVISLCGILSVLVPPVWSGFARRVHGLLLGILVGATLFAAGWFWPAHSFTTPSPATRLEAILPTYNFHERHALTIQAPAERVREALHQVSLPDIVALQNLVKIRAMVMGSFEDSKTGQNVAYRVPFLEMMKLPRSGVFPLDDTPREFVFGLAGQPWNNIVVRLKPEEFRGWARPGSVKGAVNFLIEDAGNGRSRLITETRVAATDEFARRKMAGYWALIYPGSGMIRHSLLKAIQERAERR